MNLMNQQEEEEEDGAKFEMIKITFTLLRGKAEGKNEIHTHRDTKA